MSQFEDMMKAGFAETMAEIPTSFEFRGATHTGIYSDLAESFDLQDGGFGQTIVALLMIPFSSGITPDPKHDENVTVNGMLCKIGRPVQKDEVSWTVNLISAR